MAGSKKPLTIKPTDIVVLTGMTSEVARQIAKQSQSLVVLLEEGETIEAIDKRKAESILEAIRKHDQIYK